MRQNTRARQKAAAILVGIVDDTHNVILLRHRPTGAGVVLFPRKLKRRNVESLLNLLQVPIEQDGSQLTAHPRR